MLFEHHTPTLSSADLAVQFKIYGRPCSSRVWSAGRVGTIPSCSVLGAAPNVAGRCISADAPPRTFARMILAFVCYAYPAFVLVLHPPFPPKPRSLFAVLCFVLRFCFAPFLRALYLDYIHCCTSCAMQYYHTP